MEEPTIEERVAVCKLHLRESLKWKGQRRGIFEMRRHYSNYFKGIPGVKPYRSKLVEADSEIAILSILDQLKNYRLEKA